MRKSKEKTSPAIRHTRTEKVRVSQAKKDNRRVTAITDEARIGAINHPVMPPTGLLRLRPQIQESDGSHFVRDTELQEPMGASWTR